MSPEHQRRLSDGAQARGLSGILGLVDAMAVLRGAFERKSEEFKDIIKMGRTPVAGRGA